MKKPMRILVQVAFGAGLFVAGGLLAVWFDRNFDIVPVDMSPLPARSASGAAEARRAPDDPAAPGDFAFEFEEGEKLTYRLHADIGGNALEMMSSEGVGMTFDSTMSLTTNAVDRAGNADMTMAFETARLEGEFMGSPVRMLHDATGTRMDMDQRPLVDTNRGQSVRGIPQLEFFREPVELSVGPDGRVRRVSGASGMEAMVPPGTFAAPVAFENAREGVGETWTSEFTLPVPGAGTPIPARATNTVERYETVKGRRCAVIRQDITARQRDGRMVSPESVLG